MRVAIDRTHANTDAHGVCARSNTQLARGFKPSGTEARRTARRSKKTTQGNPVPADKPNPLVRSGAGNFNIAPESGNFGSCLRWYAVPTVDPSCIHDVYHTEHATHDRRTVRTADQKGGPD